MLVRRQIANVKKSPLCWHCGSKLVGPGGVSGKEPLYYALVTPPGGTPVKVHKCCEQAAREQFGQLTAQERRYDLESNG